MLCSYFVFLTLIGSYAHGTATQNDNDNQLLIWSSFEGFIKKRCLKNANQNKYEEVLKELTSLKNVHWHSIIVEEPAFEAHPHVHCHELKPQILGYLHRFTDKLEACLEKDEKYLQQFILTGYENYSHYFCSHIKSLISDLPGNTTKCIRKFMAYPGVNPHLVCYQRSRIFGNRSPVDVITKQNLCEDLLNIHDCYTRIFNDNCEDASVLKKFQLGVMNESLADCRDVWYMMLKKYLKMQL